MTRPNGTREASRELDAEIATTIMGWTDVRMGRSWGPSEWVGDREIPKEMTTPKGRPPNAKRHGGLQSVPHYSTDIAAAWLVVEKMRERGFDISLAIETDGCSAVLLAAGTDHVVWANEPSPTAPLAICRAALMAVGVIAESESPSRAPRTGAR